jgi:hypothetical protein
MTIRPPQHRHRRAGEGVSVSPSASTCALWGEPPDFDLTLARDPEPWLLYGTTMLLSALCRDDQGLRERIAAVAASP